MADLAAGQAGNSAREGVAGIRADYLAMVHRRRMYGGILILLFVVLMASGFVTAQDRNAGGFLDGLHQLGDFPAEVLSEAWSNRANLPGLFAEFLPSLLETVNIAAVATILGVIGGAGLALLSTRGLAPLPSLIPVFRRLLDVLRSVPEIVVALVLIFILGGGPVPAVIAVALHTVGALRSGGRDLPAAVPDDRRHRPGVEPLPQPAGEGAPPCMRQPRWPTCPAGSKSDA